MSRNQPLSKGQKLLERMQESYERMLEGATPPNTYSGTERSHYWAGLIRSYAGEVKGIDPADPAYDLIDVYLRALDHILREKFPPRGEMRGERKA